MLKVAYNIKLDCYQINHVNSKIAIKPNHLETDKFFVKKIVKQMSIIYSRIINQYILNFQMVFFTRFDKQDKDDQVLDEAELYKNLNINRILTESDLDNIDIRCQWEQQIQNQEAKDRGWRFDKSLSMTICFPETTKIDCSKYVKSLIRSSAIIEIDNDDYYCFFWSIITNLHACKKNHPNRVSIYSKSLMS